MKKLIYGGFGFLVAVVLCFMIAAKPAGITHLTSLWVGDSTDTADVTPGANDLFVSGTAEIDGATRIDGAIDANSTANISGAVTFGSTLTMSSSTITPTTRGIIPLNLAAGAIDGISSRVVDEDSSPELAIRDNVQCLVWDDSSETYGVQWTLPVPPDYSSGLRLRAIVSSNAASAAPSIDWRLWFHADNREFDSTSCNQAAGTATLTSVDTSNELLTMTVDSSGDASMGTSTFFTIEIFNGGATSSNDTELKGAYLDYVRAM